jgi:hypothetical protein
MLNEESKELTQKIYSKINNQKINDENKNFLNDTKK